MEDSSSGADATTNFRLLPEIDDMRRAISDLELEQTRLDAARARESRKATAAAALARARAAADETVATLVANAASEHSHKTPEEIEAERVATLRSATSAQESFDAEYEAAFCVSSLKELLDREEGLMREVSDLSEEARRFAHFAELGAIASPTARAAIYHLWDVDAKNQPCRCAGCGVVLLLAKQYVNDKLVEVFCAKCVASNHRNQLFRDNLALQEFYVKRTFDRIDDRFRKDAEEIENELEAQARRAIEVEEKLQRELVFEARFKEGPPALSPGALREKAALRRKMKNEALGIGVV